jgi:signal transduction histidine kinase
LIVDDDATTRHLACETLQREGYRTLAAVSGDEALALFERLVPDLILLDVTMPGMDGFATLERLHRRTLGRQIPVVMMTALDDTDSIVRAFEAGATDFMIKPIHWTILRFRLQYILRASQNARSLFIAREAAEEVSRLKSELLSRMSHEMRTPLNGIIGTADLLATTALDPEQTEFVSLLRHSGDDLRERIDNLLDFSAIDTGQLEPKPGPFHVVEDVERCVASYRERAAQKGLDFKLTFGADLPVSCTCDSERVQKILRNLLDNAIKFTPQGRVSVTVSCHRRDAGGALLELAVSDTGIGIAQSQIDAIFQPFFQVDGSLTRLYQGIGLGLTVARRLTELLSGRLWATSSEGEGSTFRFAVPVSLTRLTVEERVLSD